MAERSKRQKYKIWLEAIFRIYMPQCITKAYWMFSLLPYFLMPDVAKRSKRQSFVDLLCQIEVSAITLADGSKCLIGRVSYVTSTMAKRSKSNAPITNDVVNVCSHRPAIHNTCCIDMLWLTTVTYCVHLHLFLQIEVNGGWTTIAEPEKY